MEVCVVDKRKHRVRRSDRALKSCVRTLDRSVRTRDTVHNSTSVFVDHTPALAIKQSTLATWKRESSLLVYHTMRSLFLNRIDFGYYTRTIFLFYVEVCELCKMLPDEETMAIS